MNAQESYALAERAFEAVQEASPKPLDVILILSDGGDEIGISSRLAATMPTTQEDQLRTMLRHYCSALAVIVERCDTPEELLQEINEVIRREVFAVLAVEKQP